jgi:hypothetical protein
VMDVEMAEVERDVAAALNSLAAILTVSPSAS